MPPLRSKHELAINKNFLNTQKKNLILKNLQFGFRADWTPIMPPVGVTPVNFLRGSEAIKKARARFKNEIKNGWMLGGVGWTREKVENFLGKKVYVIPCGRFQIGEKKMDELYTIIVTNTKGPGR